MPPPSMPFGLMGKYAPIQQMLGAAMQARGAQTQMAPANVATGPFANVIKKAMAMKPSVPNPVAQPAVQPPQPVATPAQATPVPTPVWRGKLAQVQ